MSDITRTAEVDVFINGEQAKNAMRELKEKAKELQQKIADLHKTSAETGEDHAQEIKELDKEYRKVGTIKLIPQSFSVYPAKNVSVDFQPNMPVKNIAVPWENVFCVIPILQNGWLSTTKLQISISQLCALTAKDKNNNKSPRTLLNVLQVLFGCESGSLTICCRLVGKEARWAVKLPTSLIDLCLMSKTRDACQFE